MPVQHWLNRYHTGVASVDQMHDALFDAMDRVYTDIINKAGSAKIAKQIVELSDQLVAHLDEEDAEMQKSGYADAEPHVANHRSLRAQLQALKKRAAAGGNIGTDALDALNQYFTVHIKQFDLPWAKTL
jgi:hemerythrin